MVRFMESLAVCRNSLTWVQAILIAALVHFAAGHSDECLWTGGKRGRNRVSARPPGLCCHYHIRCEQSCIHHLHQLAATSVEGVFTDSSDNGQYHRGGGPQRDREH